MSEQLNLLDESISSAPPLRCPSPSTTARDGGQPATRRPDGRAAVGGSDAGLWNVHGSGICVPRGTVIRSRIGNDELADLRDRLDQDSARRGVRAGAAVARKIRRSAADSAGLESLCSWLNGHGLNIIGTVTYSDAY